jgi:acyl-CoA reductase-like NAD-dependent aldehyde dehydrogenase
MSSTFHAVDPRTGANGPPVADASPDELNAVVAHAEAAALDRSLADTGARAAALRGAATRLRGRRTEIVELAESETGLPAARLTGELERTCVQLEMFSDVVLAGEYLEPIIDLADADAVPVPRPDVRRMLFPVGPVAVFGASNFPLAFSTAGGDTASALAAGCPVVVKGHPAHPQTGALVAGELARSIAEAGLPIGTFGHVLSSGFELGRQLVADDRIEAVAFTGSLRGGRAITECAASRRRPIPVYAEMGSLNPLVVTEAALRSRGDQIAEGLTASVATFGGQLCTKPGVVLFPAGASGEDFCQAVGQRLARSAAQVLLTSAIADGFASGLADLDAIAGVARVTTPRGVDGDGYAVAPAAFRAGAEALSSPALREEHFGPAVILISYTSDDELALALQRLGGQLTVSLHCESSESSRLAWLVDRCVTQAGRIIFNGYPTGVSVCWAMVHGGPYPASSHAAATSVGMTALRRFLRPVAFQNTPAELLPLALQDGNPLKLTRRVNGVLGDDWAELPLPS